jgi:EamA domain-containing membrane protein RarD
MARNMKMEFLTFSLYCISRKTVDTKYEKPRWAIWREIWKWRCLPSLYTVSVEKLWTQNTRNVKKPGGFPTEVSDMARNMKMEFLTFSLYCISRKTVDTKYTYYSWCITSTDIVKTLGFLRMEYLQWKTQVSDMARNMKMEVFTFSLYCISRKTVDTEYTYTLFIKIFILIIPFSKFS